MSSSYTRNARPTSTDLYFMLPLENGAKASVRSPKLLKGYLQANSMDYTNADRCGLIIDTAGIAGSQSDVRERIYDQSSYVDTTLNRNPNLAELLFSGRALELFTGLVQSHAINPVKLQYQVERYYIGSEWCLRDDHH